MKWAKRVDTYYTTEEVLGAERPSIALMMLKHNDELAWNEVDWYTDQY